MVILVSILSFAYYLVLDVPGSYLPGQLFNIFFSGWRPVCRRISGGLIGSRRRGVAIGRQSFLIIGGASGIKELDPLRSHLN